MNRNRVTTTLKHSQNGPPRGNEQQPRQGTENRSEAHRILRCRASLKRGEGNWEKGIEEADPAILAPPPRNDSRKRYGPPYRTLWQQGEV